MKKTLLILLLFVSFFSIAQISDIVRKDTLIGGVNKELTRYYAKGIVSVGLDALTLYKEDNVLVKTDTFTRPVTGGSASAGGSNNQVQYNNAGSFAGATNASIVGGNLTATNAAFTTPAIESQNITLDGNFLKYGDANHTTILQGTLYDYIQKKQTLLIPVNGNAVTGFGLGNFTLGTTTSISSTTMNSTNIYTRMPKIVLRQTTAGINAISSYRESQVQWYRGASGSGGFDYTIRFGYNEGPATSTSFRSFLGLMANVAAPTDVAPNTLVTCTGIGFGSTDANFQIYYNDGTGAAVEVNTGIAVPSTNANRVFEFKQQCDPAGTVINYVFNEISSSGDVLTTFTHTSTTTDLPAGNTFLANKFFAGCGGISCNPSIAIMGLYITGKF